MRGIDDIVQLWIVKADNDIRTIEHEFDAKDTVTDTVCYHSQQAVEKYLKLYLVHNNVEPPKSHNIFMLIKECERIDPSFSELENTAYLSDYAVELRYPDNFHLPDIDEAKEAFVDALRVKKFVLPKIQ